MLSLSKQSSSNSRFYVLLEVFFWDPHQLHRYGPLNILHSSKQVPSISLWYWRNERSHGIKSGDYWVCSSTVMFISIRNCRMLRALQAGGWPWWRNPNLYCHNSSSERIIRCRISLQTNRLALWRNTLCTMPRTSKNKINIILTFDFDFWLSSASTTSKTSIKCTGIWFPGRISISQDMTTL